MANKGQKAHAVLSASTSYRWLACPGCINMCKDIPPTTSTYADEGTAAHALAEICLVNQVERAEEYLGRPMYLDSKGKEYVVTQEMADAVQVYLDTIRTDMLDLGGTELFIEQRFQLDWLYEGMFGRNDAMVAEPFGILRVYDYKHGAGAAVEVENNPQLMYYGLGAVKDEKVAGAYEEIELVVVQPRAIHPDGPVRRCRMTVDKLMEWGRTVLLPGAIAASYADADLHAGKHCRFYTLCPALAICPKQKERAMEVAKQVFEPVPTAPPAPEALSLKDIRKVLDSADLIEAWLRACRVHVRNLLESGKATSEQVGYKIVPGRASRKWTDEKEAESMMEMLGIDPYERSLKSPAKAEKEAKKGAFKEIIVETRGTQLVPNSDKREAIQPAITAFGEVEL